MTQPSASGGDASASAGAHSARPAADGEAPAADGGGDDAQDGAASGSDAGTALTALEQDAALPPASPGGAAASDAGVQMYPGRGPYFTSGQWHGFFWIAHHGAGTTVTATSFMHTSFEPPLCIRGSVVPTPDNTSNAMLGVNLNQPDTQDMTVQTIAPSADGLLLDVKNNAGSALRVQIQALDGAVNDQARWCAPVSGSGGFIPWTAFNTACWDNSGAPYRLQPISGAMLLVPGSPSESVTYDVCLNALSEASAPAAAESGASGAP